MIFKDVSDTFANTREEMLTSASVDQESHRTQVYSVPVLQYAHMQLHMSSNVDTETTR